MLETEVPTRAEIAEMLGTIKPKKGPKLAKKARNDQRKAKVREALPVEIFDQVETDLESYSEWEKEVDDKD